MQQTDKQLIQDIQQYRCSDCIPELRSRHIGLVMDIYAKYGQLLNNLNFNIHEFNDELDNLIYISAKKFDLKRNDVKFSTWLGAQTRFFCLNKINSLKKKKTVEAEPDALIRLIDDCYNADSEEKTKNKETCKFIFETLEGLEDKRVIKIFNLRYMSGPKKATWKEIGEEMGLSSQQIINIHRRTLKLLREVLENDAVPN